MRVQGPVGFVRGPGTPLKCSRVLVEVIVEGVPGVVPGVPGVDVSLLSSRGAWTPLCGWLQAVGVLVIFR